MARQQNIKALAQYKPELRYTRTGKALCNWTLTAENGTDIRAQAWQAVAESIVEETFYDQILPGGTWLDCTGYWRTETYGDKSRRVFVLTERPDIDSEKSEQPF